MTAKSARAIAKEAGHTTYFTGIPCKHGHLAPRSTANGSCNACSAERRRAAWAADPEKSRAKEREYRASNPEWVAKRNALSRKKWDDLDPGRVVRRVGREKDASNREEAASNGRRHYESVLPCPKGHLGTRYTATTRCVACQIARNASKVVTLSLDEAQEKATKIAEKKVKAAERSKAKAARAEEVRVSNMNRDNARASGALTYQGRPCIRGHDGVRYAGSQQCVTCAKETTAAQVNSGYYARHYAENFGRISERSKEYRASFPREHWTQKSAEWARANPEKRRAISKSYKARRRAVEDAGMTTADLLRWEAEQPKVCYWCGAKCDHSYHVDHCFPLAKGGPHCEDNLVIACAPCNTRKGAKSPHDWIDQVFREADKREIDAYLPMYDEWHTEYATAANCSFVIAPTPQLL